ncbi:hypothetical protein GCM10009641_67510 [Mycobacterium cookii]
MIIAADQLSNRARLNVDWDAARHAHNLAYWVAYVVTAGPNQLSLAASFPVYRLAGRRRSGQPAVVVVESVLDGSSTLGRTREDTFHSGVSATTTTRHLMTMTALVVIPCE